MNLKNVNIKAFRSYKQKLKELKTWAQVKGPKPLQSALSYTLDWLSPELLGTGFRMVEVSDFEIKGLVPAKDSNLDFNKEIHQGLVLNAALELSRVFINRHLTEGFYQIISSETKISKKHKWNENLNLHLSSTEEMMDELFESLQSDKKSQIQFTVKVLMGKSKKSDTVELKLMCEATNLLS